MDVSSSYRQIFKATSIMGVSGFLVLFFNLIKTKIAAITIGKIGLGLIATYIVIQSFFALIFSLGLPLSALSYLVEADTKQDCALFSLTAVALRRFFLFLALLAMITTICFSRELSKINFGDLNHHYHVLVLSITIFFSIRTSLEMLIIQGKRKVSDVARINIINGLFSCVISIFCYFSMGVNGIIYSLVLSGIINYTITKYFSEKCLEAQLKTRWRDNFDILKIMLAQGRFLWITAILTNLSAYVLNIILHKNLGLEGLGLYSAAIMFSGLLINFILSSMSTDYYPRLIAVNHIPTLLHQNINNQIEVGMVLAIPGLLSLMVFSPILVPLLYSKEYISIIHPICLFVFSYFFKILSWPLGFVLLAKKLNKLFLITEFFGHFILISATFFFVKIFGLLGSAMGLIVMNMVYFFLMVCVLKKVIDFKLSNEVIISLVKTFVFFALGIFLIFIDITISVKYSTLLLLLCLVYYDFFQKVKKMKVFKVFSLRIWLDKIWKLKIVKLSTYPK